MAQYPGIRAGLILCCMRGDKNEDLNLQTVETARKYLGDVVCAVDIAGAEGLYGTELFQKVFDRVNEYQIPMTIHAGEAAGPVCGPPCLTEQTDRPRRGSDPGRSSDPGTD